MLDEAEVTVDIIVTFKTGDEQPYNGVRVIEFMTDEPKIIPEKGVLLNPGGIERITLVPYWKKWLPRPRGG